MGVQSGEERTLSYPFEQVWPTAVRYLRLDRGYTLVEQNQDAGYVVFDYSLGDDRQGRGHIEMFQTTDPSGRPSVKLMIAMSIGAGHLPYSVLDGIAQKIRAERGQPAPPPPAPKPPKSDKTENPENPQPNPQEP